MGDLVRIYSTPNPIDGVLLKGRLEAEGIAVLMKGGDDTYRVGPAYLWVKSEDEVQARIIIESIAAGEFEGLADETVATTDRGDP